MDQVREVVDQELGFASAADPTLPDTFKVRIPWPASTPDGGQLSSSLFSVQVYLYIADAKVSGCCVAEPLRQAYSLLESPTTCHRNALDEALSGQNNASITDVALTARFVGRTTCLRLTHRASLHLTKDLLKENDIVPQHDARARAHGHQPHLGRQTSAETERCLPPH